MLFYLQLFRIFDTVRQIYDYTLASTSIVCKHKVEMYNYLKISLESQL